ncbi:response regulator [Maricaulis parjimensis]|uniref:response regulator n=1 Tax=Maricaulis parjimensis TaxID=144023 RepID=UPI00193A4DF0
MSTPKHAPRILLVEDNEGDEFLILDAFEQASYPYEIEVVRDGEEALHRIQQTDGFADAPLPDLILLDLNLPKVDGRTVLKTVKTDHDLMQLPVLILTTSSSERDIEECYELHANAYMTKPFKVEDYENIVESIGSFWFRAVQLPAH